MGPDALPLWSCGIVINAREPSGKHTSTQWRDSGVDKADPNDSEIKRKSLGEPWCIDRWVAPSCTTSSRGPACGTLLDARQALGPLIASIKTCIKTKDLVRGTEIHRQLVLNHQVEECFDSLVTMYATCGELGKAKSLFDSHKSEDVITWTALIAGHVRKGQGHIALDLFEQMASEGISPNAVSYACVLKACAMTKALTTGRRLHDEISRQGFLQTDLVLGGALVDMYVKCRALTEAHRIFEELPFRNVVCWNALITGYAQEGQAEEVLKCFEEMAHEGIFPDAVTYASVLKACATIRAIDKGKQIHQDIIRRGLLQNDVVLGNALIDMYAKCNAVMEGHDVLNKLACRDVVSWNSLVAGYAEGGEAEQAWNCLKNMREEGMLPNAVTFICALKACARSRAGDWGKQIHEEVVKQELLHKDAVLGNALVDMYAKCGNISEAQRVLQELPSRNVATWNALISGFAQKGDVKQALNCLKHMQCQGITPNSVTYVCALKACAASKAMDLGEQIHNIIATNGLLRSDNALGNALVDMYVKCASLSRAWEVLVGLPYRDVVSWSTVICGYAQKGEAEQALRCFEQMQSEGILPDTVTLAAVLNVCSHRGLVKEGQSIFLNVCTKLGVKPSLECYTVMIDLLGRAGHLEKAAIFVQKMPSTDHVTIWRALLGACQKWVDVDVGEWAFKQIVNSDKCEGSAYVLMASIYTAAGMIEKARNIESMRMRNKA